MIERRANRVPPDMPWFDHPRSPDWPQVEAQHLKIQPYCVCCGRLKSGPGLRVHHIIPYQICHHIGRPDLELDERNLITLCEGPMSENHHLVVGHLQSLLSYNLEVAVDARFTFYGLNRTQILENPWWLSKVTHRPEGLEEMTGYNRDWLINYANDRFPRKAPASPETAEESYIQAPPPPAERRFIPRIAPPI